MTFVAQAARRTARGFNSLFAEGAGDAVARRHDVAYVGRGVVRATLLAARTWSGWVAVR